MRLPRWFLPVLVIALFAIGGGWLLARESAAPGTVPIDAVVPFDAAAIRARFPDEVSVPAQRLQQVPPRRPQTPVDEHLDPIPNPYGERHRRLPPWFAVYGDAPWRYRNAQWSTLHQQGVPSRRRHTTWFDPFCPSSKPQRAWSSRHGYSRQMEQRGQQRHPNTFTNQPRFAPPGLWGWEPAIPGN